MLIDGSISPLPVYDTTDLHAKALVEAALHSAAALSASTRRAVSRASANSSG